jgi:hypothetical protein
LPMKSSACSLPPRMALSKSVALMISNYLICIDGFRQKAEDLYPLVEQFPASKKSQRKFTTNFRLT